MAGAGAEGIQGSDPAAQLRDAAVIATGAAALSYSAIFLLRGGLEGTLAQYGGMFILAILPVWLSAWAIGRFGGSNLNLGLAALVSLFGGVLFPLLGLVAGPLSLLAAAAILLFTFGACVIRLRIGGGKLIGLLVMTLLSAGLTVMLGGAIRLFMPEALTLGVAPSDAYWHTAIMQMIGRHGVPSIGADGLVYQHYHYLFHMLAAGTAAMTGTQIPLAYGLWSALALKIQLVWCLVGAGCLLFRARGDHAAAWRFAYAWVAAILAYGFETESYVLGIVLFAGWLPLMLFVLRTTAVGGKEILCIALLGFCLFFIALAKASVGYFGVIALFLLLWIHRARPAVAALAAAGIVGMGLFAEVVLIPKELVMTASGLPILVNSYLMYFSRGGVGLHYALPALLAVIYAMQPRALLLKADGAVSLKLDAAPQQDTTRPLPGWIARGKGLAAPLRFLARTEVHAQLLFLMWLGLLFVLFTMPIGDNIWDFSAPLFSISLMMLPAALDSTLGLGITTRAVKWVIAFLLAMFVLHAATVFTFYPGESLVGAVTDLYRRLSNGAKVGESVGARRGIRQSLAQTGKPFSDLQARIDLYPVAKFQHDVARTAASVDGHLAIAIAPQADEVWRFFQEISPVKWCMFPHLMASATTGMIEIRAIPPARIQQECSPDGLVWYGFGKYQDQHRTGDFSPDDLCRMARPLGIRKVYRLLSYAELSKNSVIACP